MFDDDVREAPDAPESAPAPASTTRTTPPPATDSPEEPETFLATDDPSLEVLPDVSVLARQAGVDVPELPEGAGVTFTESALADFLNWAVDEGLNKAAIGSVLEMYATWLTVEGRGLEGRAVERPGDEKIWRGRLTERGLTKAQVDRLIGWHKVNTTKA